MAWPLRRVVAKGVLINTAWNPLGSFCLFSWRLWPFAGLLLSNKAFLRVVGGRGGLYVGKMLKRSKKKKTWGWELMVFPEPVCNDTTATALVFHKEPEMRKPRQDNHHRHGHRSWLFLSNRTSTSKSNLISVNITRKLWGHLKNKLLQLSKTADS